MREKEELLEEFLQFKPTKLIAIIRMKYLAIQFSRISLL